MSFWLVVLTFLTVLSLFAWAKVGNRTGELEKMLWGDDVHKAQQARILLEALRDYKGTSPEVMSMRDALFTASLPEAQPVYESYQQDPPPMEPYAGPPRYHDPQGYPQGFQPQPYTPPSPYFSPPYGSDQPPYHPPQP